MDSELNSMLTTIRNSSLDVLKLSYETCIPSDLTPPTSFWDAYTNEKLAIGLRACLATWAASQQKIIPNELQLKGTIALMSGQDALVDAGTGYGKTLHMIIPCLLDSPGTISIVVSPLKYLQAAQALEFEQYGITTMAINEDTPNDSKLWKDIASGEFSLLFLQPEQLARTLTGHLPRFARLILYDRLFRNRIVRVHVDEAHLIYTAGVDLYGLPASRSAWGRLSEFRIKLNKGVVFQALSGMQPEHIKTKIIEHLRFDEGNICSIKLSSNQPNTVYAAHPIVGSLSDFRNLDFLIPDPFPVDYRLPKTLVFHDDPYECGAAAGYLDERLPQSLQGEGLVKHFHDVMSKTYLTLVYNDFKQPDGTCRILHVTEEALTGLDLPDIDVVIQYGVARDVPTTLQRGGLAGRSGKPAQAIYLIMYEPWVINIDLSTINFGVSDPDHPTVEKLSKTSTKQERTGMAMVKIIQSPDCLRKLYADYLGDKTPNALKFTTRCCSRHSEPISFGQFFKGGRFLYQDTQTGDLYYSFPNDSPDRRIKVLVEQKEKQKTQDKCRAREERKSLMSRLVAWRHNAHTKDPLAFARPPSFIIDDASIVILAKLHSQYLTDYHQITVTLDQTVEWEEEWSEEIFDVIHQFDQDLIALRQTIATQQENEQSE